MKTYTKIIPVAALMAAMLFNSCERDDWNNIRGKGPVVSETRDVDPFLNVSVSIPAEVYIYQGPGPELTIEAQDNILDAIESRVRHGELQIGLYNEAGLAKHETIKIYISSVSYNNIRFSGAVDGWAETPLYVTEFNIYVSGSGTFSGEVYALHLSSNLSGSGKLWLSGKTDEQFHSISGSGEIYAFDLQSKTADISISGSGEAEVSVDEYLYADISGSGTIYYKGNPIIESRISGSGKLVRVN